MMRLPCLAALVALAAASGPALADDPPPKPSVGLDYKIFIGGLEALAASVTIAADPNRYDVEIKARTAGAIGKLFPWLIDIGSKGNVAGGTLQPVEHAQTSNFQGKQRSVILDYDGHGGFLARRVVPDAHEDQRDEVPPEQTRDTLDIVSAVLAGLRNVDKTGSCNSRVPVFDGRRRFDLVYSDDGHETLDGGSAATFSGDAVKCAVRVEPVAGFWKKNQRRFWSRRVNGQDEVVPIEVYVARVGAADMEVPVRVESTSPFGPLVLNLQGIRDSPKGPGG